MPAGATVMSKKARVIAREEAEPVVSKVRQLLLRGGARGVTAYMQAIATAYTATQPRANAATRATSPPPPTASTLATSQRPTAPAKLRRLSPEDLKSTTRDAGVLLSSAEYKTLLLAFCDTVGFVIVDTYLAALSEPTTAAQAASEAAVLAAMPGSPSRATATVEVEGESYMALPSVTLDSVLDLLMALFSPLEPQPEDKEGLSVEANNASAQLQLAYEDAADAFTLARYPSGQVPGDHVLAFVLAVLELNSGHRCCAETVRARLASASGVLTPSPAGPAGLATVAAQSASAAPTSFAMTHTGVRTQRKFEYYQEEDRRDEWIRGRDEKDAQKSYQRHVVGYGGHLPEYQYHFGRTFHVIEEDLPLLSRPKPALEAAPADAYGPARELKESRMNAHHYRLA